MRFRTRKLFGKATNDAGKPSIRVFRVFRGSIACAVASVVAAVAITAAQDEKVSTPEDLDRVMKKSQPAMQATQKAIAAGAYADAKTQLATLRQTIVDSQNFWVEKKRDDALKMNQETLDKIDALDKILSSDAVDRATAMTGLKEVGISCRPCHDKYRATDAQENFIIKPGSLDGKQ